MATNFIPITRGVTDAIFAGDMLELVRKGREFWDILEKVRDKGFEIKGSPNDWPEYEKLNGIPTDKGNTVFDMINGVYLALTNQQQNDQFRTFINRVG